MASDWSWNFFRESWTWFHFSTFVWNVKSVNDNFPNLSWFFVKNFSISAWFHVKLLKLRELNMIRDSQHRIEVKRNFVKCRKLLLKVNFPWMWIHWPIYSFTFQLLKFVISLEFLTLWIMPTECRARNVCTYWKKLENEKKIDESTLLFNRLTKIWWYQLVDQLLVNSNTVCKNTNFSTK